MNHPSIVSPAYARTVLEVRGAVYQGIRRGAGTGQGSPGLAAAGPRALLLQHGRRDSESVALEATSTTTPTTTTSTRIGGRGTV